MATRKLIESELIRAGGEVVATIYPSLMVGKVDGELCVNIEELARFNRRRYMYQTLQQLKEDGYFPSPSKVAIVAYEGESYPITFQCKGSGGIESIYGDTPVRCV